MPAAERNQLVAYIQNVLFAPKNFQEGTEAYEQWTYSSRKRNAKKVMEATRVK